MNIKTILLITSALSIGLNVFAKPVKVAKDDNRNPTGCQDSGYSYDLKTIKLLPVHEGAKHSMYFFFNQSNTQIELHQMRHQESSRSLFLNHALNPQLWSVLATNEPEIQFICTKPEKGYRYGKPVDCSEVVRVCEFTHVKFGLNNRGNYWMVDNNSRNGALHAVVTYGIIPAQ
ncbi:MAG: endopeptidase IV [Legionellaceae bacterium]|nr:endopeptidase IV [Legionellaceae bacterium]